MLVLPVELTHDQAEACLLMLLKTARAQEASDVLVDAAALSHFDSSALAVLLECRRQCLADGKTGFAVRGLAPRLRELADLYGVAGLLADAPDAAQTSIAS